MKSNSLIASVLLICLALLSNAQDKKPEVVSTWDEPEHGELSEIVNKHKVIVLTQDLEAYKIIAKQLKKDSSLQIVEDGEDAEFMISYSRVDDGVSRVGEIRIVTRGRIDRKNQLHQRIVWSTRKRQGYSVLTLNRDPALNGINQFLSDLKKARASKTTQKINP